MVIIRISDARKGLLQNVRRTWFLAATLPNLGQCYVHNSLQNAKNACAAAFCPAEGSGASSQKQERVLKIAELGLLSVSMCIWGFMKCSWKVCITQHQMNTNVAKMTVKVQIQHLNAIPWISNNVKANVSKRSR